VSEVAEARGRIRTK